MRAVPPHSTAFSSWLKGENMAAAAEAKPALVVTPQVKLSHMETTSSSEEREAILLLTAG